MDSALETGATAMRVPGYRAFRAHRAARTFRRHEEKSRRTLFEPRSGMAPYAEQVRERASELEERLRADERDVGDLVDHAWEPAWRPDG